MWKQEEENDDEKGTSEKERYGWKRFFALCFNCDSGMVAMSFQSTTEGCSFMGFHTHSVDNISVNEIVESVFVLLKDFSLPHFYYASQWDTCVEYSGVFVYLSPCACFTTQKWKLIYWFELFMLVAYIFSLFRYDTVCCFNGYGVFGEFEYF